MNEAQQKAWDCLLEIERQSLFLRLSYGKSSWEVGTILKLSHYKYIELRSRSEKFFRMFTDFFTKHPSIFRPQCPCDDRFKDYIEAVIEKRMTRVQASDMMGDSSQCIPKVRAKVITKNMAHLKESEDPWDIDTLILIGEFDRWNNTRILPRMLQQPSPYKRRSNKKDKIYINYLINRVPEWIHERIIERFRYKAKPSIRKRWVCLISQELYIDGYILLPVRPSDEVVKEMNRFYMYVFDDKDDADTFGFMVSKFIFKTKGVKLGQKFWPEYRYLVQKAVNYNDVNNIYFNIKSLDMAYMNRRYAPKEKKQQLTGEQRADSDIFY